MKSREFDIVVFGATGFTGELVAHYLAKGMPSGKTWAIAGRDEQRVQVISERLKREYPDCNVGILRADVGDPASLARMAARTCVVLTTVGPYMDYGEPVLRACVEAGTHHFDIAGEPDFLDLAERVYDQPARSAKVAIVHACGFGSLPPDAGAFFTAKRLPAEEEKAIRAYIWSNARPSGGTVRAILRACAKGRLSLLGRLTRPCGKPIRLPALKASIHRMPELGGWAVPTPVVDTWIVAKSAHAHPAVYGPGFQYAQYFVLPNLFVVFAVLVGAGVLVVATWIPPLLWLLERLLVRPGGPSAEQRSQMKFSVTFYGQSPSRRIVTRVSGGDPGYDEASKMLAECGLLLIERPPDAPFGVLSPIAALGNRLIERLQARSIAFEVVESTELQSSF